MNRNQHDETVYQVAADTLESLALMFLVPQEEAPQPGPSCDKRVAVTFRGPFGGALVLAVSEGVLPELAANMLGLSDISDATAAQQEDALKELVNVICGNLLPAVAGTQPVFHISAPEVLKAGQWPQSAGQLSPAGEARLLADAGTLQLQFFVDQASEVLA